MPALPTVTHCRNAVVWGNRSACFLRLDKHEKALQDAQIARALDPSYVKVWGAPACYGASVV
jgi:hypothetical protein